MTYQSTPSRRPTRSSQPRRLAAPPPRVNRSPTGRSERWFEMATGIVLAVVAVATAWSGYQAAHWGGVQAKRYTQASADPRCGCFRMVLLESAFTGRFATPLGARGMERSPKKPLIWSPVMSANNTSVPKSAGALGTSWYNQPRCAG